MLTATSSPHASSRWWTGAAGAGLVTVVIQGCMVGWAWEHHLIYGFGDSLSHMTIARQLWDAPNPGIAQLGTNWLPLPHLVFSIPSLWTWAWSNGLAGSICTVTCAVIASVALFKIAERAGVGRAGGWVAALALATNPSWSYLSAVPMTEPFTVATMCLATAGIMGWARSERPYSVGFTALFCGFPTAAAIMTRYEAWGFAVLASVAFVWVSWRRLGWGPAMRRQVGAFVVLPAAAIIWLITFNWAVFGNPLAFENGPYSSKVLVAPLGRLGELPAKGNVAASFSLYGRTVVDAAGVGLVVAAGVGLVFTMLTWRGLRVELWLCLAGAGLFVVASLWQGQDTIRLPGLTPPGVFNTRFGVEFLPFLAVASAQTLRVASWTAQAGRLLARGLAVVLLVACSGGWLVGLANGTIPGTAITVLEAKTDARAGSDQRLLGEWLHRHASHGYVLLDNNVFPVLPIVGFDLHRVVATFSGSLWKEALAHPKMATWVAVAVGDRSDVVWTSLRRDGLLDTIFIPVAAFGRDVILRQGTTPQPTADQLLPPSTSSTGR
ncbi:MAG: hypothetical protein ACYCSF_02505 [Acidimicrobiales bacterium]